MVLVVCSSPPSGLERCISSWATTRFTGSKILRWSVVSRVILDTRPPLWARFILSWLFGRFDWSRPSLCLSVFPQMIIMLKVWSRPAPLSSVTDVWWLGFYFSVICPLTTCCWVVLLRVITPFILMSPPLLLAKPPRFFRPGILVFTALFQIPAWVFSSPVRSIRSIHERRPWTIGTGTSVVTKIPSRSLPPGAGAAKIPVPFSPPSTSASPSGSILFLVGRMLTQCIIWMIVAEWGFESLMKVSILLRRIITVATQVPVIVVSGPASPRFVLIRFLVWRPIWIEVRWVCKQRSDSVIIKGWSCVSTITVSIDTWCPSEWVYLNYLRWNTMS